MRGTVRLRLGAMVATISLFGAGAAHAQTEVTRFSSNGAFASHNSFDGTTAFDLSANRNDSGSGSTTFLSFITQTCNSDFTVCSGTQGFGNIPNADFSASNGTASVNTNLATNSGFQVVNYVSDNGTYTQTPGVRGLVNVTWKKIPRQSQSSTGTQTFVSGGFSVRNTGTRSSDSATSTGILLGMPLPTTSSSLIGLDKSSQMLIIRN
jgi:hypothetical protein